MTALFLLYSLPSSSSQLIGEIQRHFLGQKIWNKHNSMELVDVCWSLKCKHSTFTACLPAIISLYVVFLRSSYVYTRYPFWRRVLGRCITFCQQRMCEICWGDVADPTQFIYSWSASTGVQKTVKKCLNIAHRSSLFWILATRWKLCNTKYASHKVKYLSNDFGQLGKGYITVEHTSL